MFGLERNNFLKNKNKNTFCFFNKTFALWGLFCKGNIQQPIFSSSYLNTRQFFSPNIHGLNFYRLLTSILKLSVVLFGETNDMHTVIFPQLIHLITFSPNGFFFSSNLLRSMLHRQFCISEPFSLISSLLSSLTVDGKKKIYTQ